MIVSADLSSPPLPLRLRLLVPVAASQLTIMINNGDTLPCLVLFLLIMGTATHLEARQKIASCEKWKYVFVNIML